GARLGARPRAAAPADCDRARKLRPGDLRGVRAASPRRSGGGRRRSALPRVADGAHDRHGVSDGDPRLARGNPQSGSLVGGALVADSDRRKWEALAVLGVAYLMVVLD